MDLKILNILIVLGMLAGLVFLLKKLLERKQTSEKGSKYIKVVDKGIHLGIGSQISILKVGNQHMIVAYGQNGVTFKEIDSDLFLKEEKWSKEFEATQIESEREEGN